jgi:hypothetical protein
MRELAELFAEYLKSSGFEICEIVDNPEEPESLIWFKMPGQLYSSLKAIVKEDAIYVCGGSIRFEMHHPNSFTEAASISRLCFYAEKNCYKCAVPKLVEWQEKCENYEPAAEEV